MRKVSITFWKGKKVFLTGHTGFKGSWMALWLQDMDAIVKGYALESPTSPSLFLEACVAEGMESLIGDIRDYSTLLTSMVSFAPDILIHMAAQPLVRLSYKDPVETYSTNVMGTVHVLEAARNCPTLKSIVVVTSDKCYENKEWHWGYRENEPMGGHDPYSSSKGCAELVVNAYQRSFFHSAESAFIASARAGNVLGGGDWALDRLVPDVLRAFDLGEKVMIRFPQAIRPWQHVLEPLSGYLMLAESLYQQGDRYAEPWNFGPKDEDCLPVAAILDRLMAYWPTEGTWELDGNNHPHEATFLKLDCSKAGSKLQWHPKWHADETLQRIVKWHQAWKDGADMRQYCLQEIQEYNQAD